MRPQDLELAERLRGLRPRREAGVLLSPFDPVLWDRPRVQQLFGFEQFIEIYKKPHQRVYGYYVLPVLAGDRLIGRVDLKADRKAGRSPGAGPPFRSGRAERGGRRSDAIGDRPVGRPARLAAAIGYTRPSPGVAGGVLGVNVRARGGSRFKGAT